MTNKFCAFEIKTIHLIHEAVSIYFTLLHCFLHEQTKKEEPFFYIFFLAVYTLVKCIVTIATCVRVSLVIAY